MADIASLSLDVNFDKVKGATAALRDMPAAASAAERAAQKWGAGTAAAARSADDFSKRVQNTIKDLEFQRAQLARTSTEQERFTALRRAGVAASSAEGAAITASVRALQAQKAALADNSTVVEKVRSSWSQLRSILVTFGALAVAQKIIETAKAAFEAAAGLDELAQQLGITARGLQALQLQAVQNGVNLEQLETGVSKFSQKMGEAAGGSKEMIDSLTQLGVKILDANGNLRPTEVLLQDVAKAIGAIDDPAKRSAAAVDFFGKAGTRMLPLLGEIAKGIDGMAASAERSGAIISDETIAALDRVADRMEKSKLEWRAFFANNAATAIEFFDKLGVMWDQSAQAINKWVKETAASFTGWVDGLNETLIVGSARATASFLESFAQVPDQLGKLFTDAWNSALTATANGINTITAWIASNAPSWMGLTGGTNIQPLLSPGGGANVAGMSAGVLAAGQKAAADAQAQIAAARDAADRQATINRQAAMAGDDARARIGKLGATLPPGAGNPPPKGAGTEAANQEKAYQKLAAQLTETAKAQDLMTAASAKGDQQFEAVKIHLEAQQKTLEIYGKVLDDTDPKLRKIEELLTKIATGKAAEAFNVATTELQKQNVILEAQIALMNQAPEIQAREIALIKSKQEAEKAGTAVTQEMIDARKTAIEQNETLKNQQEEIKKAQDLWTEPLKRALGDIQSTAADAFEQILTSGNISFQSLGDTFKKVLVKMAAEFLALATIRPVMSVVVNAVGGQGMASQMGLGTGNTAGGGLGGMLGGGGGGGLSDLFSSGGGGILDKLGKVFGNSGPVGTGVMPGAGNASFGDLGGAGGSFGTSSLGTMGSFGGMSAVSGGLGIASGAMGLLTNKKPTTASTIGNVGTMVGGALMMIPTGYTQIAGAIIMAASAILPGLFGGTPEPPKNNSQANLQMGAKGFFTTGVAAGPDANSLQDESQLAAAGKNISAILDIFGGVKDWGKVWGASLQSFSQGDFSNQSSFLVGPDGTMKPWGVGSTEKDVGLNALTAQAAIKSILGGAVGDITENMRKALGTVDTVDKPVTLENVAQTVADIKAFDDALAKMGKTVSDAQTALDAVDDSFKAMYDTVTKYGLDKGQVDAQVQAAKSQIGKTFSESIAYQLMDVSSQAMSDIDKQRTIDYANNAALLAANIQGYADQATNIEEIYQRKRLQIMKDANAEAIAAQEAAAAAQRDFANAIAQTVSRVQDLIDRLTPGGDLANVDPRTQLAGLRASYNASYAQAISDPTNDALIQKAIQDAAAFTETSLKFNAGNSAYEQDRQTILSQAQVLQQATASGGMSQATDPDVKNLLAKILQAVNAPATNDNAAQRDADIATVMALLARYLANGRTAA